MANNYLSFSELLPLTEGAMGEAEREWWLKVVHEPEGIENADDAHAFMDAHLKGLGIDTTGLDLSFWPDFNSALEGQCIWIYADSGNFYNVAAVVQGFLNQFQPNVVWTMEWASYCDKLRVDEFSGGVVAVSAKRNEIVGTYGIRKRLQKELSEEVQ